MTALSNIKQAIDAVATAAKLGLDNTGDLVALNTTQTASVVAALNSLKTEVDAAAGGGVAIDDGSTTAFATWSSSKISTELSGATQAAIDSITGGTLDAAKDQLVELVAFIEANESSITAMLATQANRVAFDVAQSKTALEQAQARSNIDAPSATDLGDLSIDFNASVVAILGA